MTKLIIISLIVALILFLILVMLAGKSEPKVREVPLTDKEKAEIEEMLAPYLEVIKRRIDYADGSCSICRYANRDMDKEPCRDCLRLGGRDRYEPRETVDDEIVASYVKMMRDRQISKK